MALRIYLEHRDAFQPYWGHLYLVLRDDLLSAEEAKQSALVIRGGPAPRRASRCAVTVARPGGKGGAVSAFAQTRRPRTILRSTLAVAGFVAVALGTLSLGAPSVAGATPATAQEPPIDQCLDPQVCPIPYVRLSTQETEPFLFLGKVVDESHPRYGEYKKALRRFPKVRSCLNDDEREKPRPDLRQIDWKAIENIQEIDVCVFRIAASIADVRLIRDWLQYHGIRLVETRKLRPPSRSKKYEKEPTFGFAAYLTADQFRTIIPRSWFANVIGFEALRGYSLTLLFSSSGEIVEVTSGGGTIFN